jgi:hypothetical protein
METFIVWFSLVVLLHVKLHEKNKAGVQII